MIYLIFSLILILIISIPIIHALLMSFAIKKNKVTNQSYEANLSLGLILILSLIIVVFLIIISLSLINSKFVNISYFILIALYSGCMILSYYLYKNDSKNKDNIIIFALNISILVIAILLFLLKNIFISQYKKFF
jgi:hypothetical protein